MTVAQLLLSFGTSTRVCQTCNRQFKAGIKPNTKERRRGKGETKIEEYADISHVVHKTRWSPQDIKIFDTHYNQHFEKFGRSRIRTAKFLRQLTAAIGTKKLSSVGNRVRTYNANASVKSRVRRYTAKGGKGKGGKERGTTAKKRARKVGKKA